MLKDKKIEDLKKKYSKGSVSELSNESKQTY
jgi:hypothetical protein